MLRLILALMLLLTPSSVFSATDYCNTAIVGSTLDESTYTNDCSSNENNFTAASGVSTNTTTCKYGDCAYSNSTSDFGFYPSTANVCESTSTAMVWINSDDSTDNMLLLGCSNTDGRVGFKCVSTTDGYVSCSFNDTQWSSTFSMTGDEDVITNSYEHVAIVYNSSSTAYIYVNGSVDSSASGSDIGYWQSSVDNFYVAGKLSGGRHEYTGYFDEPMYHGDVLTNTEINEIINYGIDGSKGSVIVSGIHIIGNNFILNNGGVF